MNGSNWTEKWYFGANFIPSTAINQLEMWQAETFDPRTIDRELGFAETIGMNIMRVYLHDLLWEQDSRGFLERMEEYLAIAGRHGIATIFVFFDDCWNTEFALGKQPAPKLLTHNSGWVQSPGNRAADDPAQRPRLERYVKGVMTRFARDKRIVLWDLYNEPGNGAAGDHVTCTGLRDEDSLPLLRDVFQWADEVERDQPVTAAVWRYDAAFDGINRFLLEHSEVVTYHDYTAPAAALERINFIRFEARGRPVLCSEYMARHTGSTFAGCTPQLKKNRIGAVNWGLAAGKTQTVYPWKCYMNEEALNMPFHDIFNPDGTFLIPAEEEVFKNL